MKVWYDTEFVDTGTSIELISIGLVAEDGREYYAVNSDTPRGMLGRNDWLLRNVVPSLPIANRASLDAYLKQPASAKAKVDFEVALDLKDTRVKPRWVIANEVRDFLQSIPDLELWAWYAAYDHVALAQLWGRMTNLPAGVPMWTNDLKQECMRLGNPAMPEQAEGLHNALADARRNRVMHEFLETLAKGDA
ncbi:hypothetical protein HII36_29870 [Nonomuraea sp. NN258]|uniref:3'-5' exoribonuclease domain-containing protein n=1 Tax=Nonomuraea antri TaxID=2730852 RepID=UPI00156803FB|nr:3'-5' exoribonuclease [Nonomuraea antri]NRQ36009.1 hypothetical protein [Nonomuraea antri]